MLLLWKLLVLQSFMGCLADNIALHGPSFTLQPKSIVFPVDSMDNKVAFNCEAKGNPPPYYRWKLNGTVIDPGMDYRYSLVGGHLHISNLNKDQDVGTFQCVASNTVGTIVSKEAVLQFAYLEHFKTQTRSTVSVREGQGVVLLCGPPPHSGGLMYSWIFNEYPAFMQQDTRRFVSQETGNMYIAKVEPSDVGNYTCVVTNTVTNSRVQGPTTPLVLRTDGVMGEYEPKIEVHFPEIVPVAKGSTVKLECFALGNPVPSISWRRADGIPFSRKVEPNKSNGVLEIPYFQQDDAGSYECIAENSRGKNVAKGRLAFYAQPHWLQKLNDAHLPIEAGLLWECRAMGKPNVSYRWLKNGEPLEPLQERIQVRNGVLAINTVSLSDSGMYQCVAENKHGVIYSNAELQVIAIPPDFIQNQLKKLTMVIEGGEVVIECKPRMSPKGVISWRKGNEALRENERITVLEDGSLRITNVTKFDDGSYTCVARNQFGGASSRGSLVVKDPTIITVPPSNMDVTVGESIVLPCQVSHDHSLAITFTWSYNGQLIDFKRDGDYFEKVGGHSAGDMMIRNIQVKHAGKYVCMVQTSVDTASAGADLVVRGPPGPPESIEVEEMTDTTALLSWRPGLDNHSPITTYTIQARTPFSVGWQAVTTVPEVIDGKKLTATVGNLNPWVEYEFRVVANNAIGIGEASVPSKKSRTKEGFPKVTPANVSGGGGSQSELVITWEPVPEELQNGGGFGYVVAFRPVGATSWMQAAVTSADASRYVFKNESTPPFSPYEVKVGVYNNKGEGPFGPLVTIYSAEEEPSRAPNKIKAKSLSASEMEVSWKPLPWNTSKRRVLGYELRYWDQEGKEETASSVRKLGNKTSSAVIRGVKGSTLYYITVRAYNSAGVGPGSDTVNVTTRKPPPSQPPLNILWNSSHSKIMLHWDQVKALENESEVTGYKVLYKRNRQSRRNVIETNTTSVELSLSSDEEYIIQIQPLSDGGEGSSSKLIIIPRILGPDAVGSASKVSTLSALSTIVLSFTARSTL